MREHKLSVQTNDFIPYVICESESIQPEALGLSVNWDKSKLANKVRLFSYCTVHGSHVAAQSPIILPHL